MVGFIDIFMQKKYKLRYSKIDPPWLKPSYCKRARLITVVADALVPCVDSPSATLVLARRDRQVLAFQEEGFEPPVPSECREIKEDKMQI